MKFTIYYVYHSSFIIETSDSILLFDYFKVPAGRKGELYIPELLKTSKKKIYIFSSHGHHDHFNDSIFEFTKYSADISYILSDDIIHSQNDRNIIKVKEGDNIKVGSLNIRVFGSTDLGVSFYIETTDGNFFHSGDLNWWYWDDDTEEEAKIMREHFFKILYQIKKEKKIDVAFFPVDPRLGENSYLGAEIFCSVLKPKFLVSMHFQNDYSVIRILKSRILVPKTEIISISLPCQKILSRE